MTSIAAPSVSRPFIKTVPINSSSQDYSNDTARISLPCYIDVNNNDRKALLNGVRQACYQPSAAEATRSVSGISVESSSNRQAEIESFLGMSIDVLRTVLFQRGGLAADLFFKLQAVSGLELVSDKDLTAAFKARQTQVKECKSSLSFT
jgi:hypothetical protein